MPSPNPSVQNTVFVESETERETESETESDLDIYAESDPDEYPIENQLGIPEYQNIFIESSPPPVDVNVNANVELNNEAEAACRVQDGRDEGIDSGVGANTEIVLSSDDKKTINIKIHVEGPYRSHPTIIINVGQVHFRETKHKRGIESIGGTEELHTQAKKTRK